MPKLDSKAAEIVNSHQDEESTGFKPIEEGLYEVSLLEVSATKKDGTPRVGNAGPYWLWAFEIPADAPRYGKRRFWNITSLSADSAWRLKQVFDAFGVSADTDTDELVGKRVMIDVGQRIATQGENAGETENFVRKILPLDGTAPAAAGKGDKGKAKADLF